MAANSETEKENGNNGDENGNRKDHEKENGDKENENNGDDREDPFSDEDDDSMPSLVDDSEEGEEDGTGGDKEADLLAIMDFDYDTGLDWDLFDTREQPPDHQPPQDLSFNLEPREPPQPQEQLHQPPQDLSFNLEPLFSEELPHQPQEQLHQPQEQEQPPQLLHLPQEQEQPPQLLHLPPQDLSFNLEPLFSEELPQNPSLTLVEQSQPQQDPRFTLGEQSHQPQDLSFKKFMRFAADDVEIIKKLLLPVKRKMDPPGSFLKRYGENEFNTFFNTNLDGVEFDKFRKNMFFFFLKRKEGSDTGYLGTKNNGVWHRRKSIKDSRIMDGQLVIGHRFERELVVGGLQTGWSLTEYTTNDLDRRQVMCRVIFDPEAKEILFGQPIQPPPQNQSITQLEPEADFEFERFDPDDLEVIKELLEPDKKNLPIPGSFLEHWNDDRFNGFFATNDQGVAFDNFRKNQLWFFLERGVKSNPSYLGTREKGVWKTRKGSSKKEPKKEVKIKEGRFIRGYRYEKDLFVDGLHTGWQLSEFRTSDKDQLRVMCKIVFDSKQKQFRPSPEEINPPQPQD